MNAAGSIYEGKNVTVGAASQTALSFLRVYHDVTNKRIFPFLTAIMSVDKGIVTSVIWDDACVFCGGLGECVENTYNFDGVPQNSSSAEQVTQSCFLTTKDCDELLTGDPASTSCDITLYTVWTGTDADGKALQSQAYRFSAFPAQQLTDRITQLLPSFGTQS